MQPKQNRKLMVVLLVVFVAIVVICGLKAAYSGDTKEAQDAFAAMMITVVAGIIVLMVQGAMNISAFSQLVNKLTSEVLPTATSAYEQLPHWNDLPVGIFRVVREEIYKKTIQFIGQIADVKARPVDYLAVACGFAKDSKPIGDCIDAGQEIIEACDYMNLGRSRSMDKLIGVRAARGIIVPALRGQINELRKVQWNEYHIGCIDELVTVLESCSDTCEKVAQGVPGYDMNVVDTHLKVVTRQLVSYEQQVSNRFC